VPRAYHCRRFDAVDRVAIPYGEWLSLEFAVLDFNAEHRHRYAYRLGGEARDWVDIGSRREVTLTRLEPGSYEFSLKGRNSQGIWSSAATSLRIDVVPPFWMTAWFRALALVSIAFLVATAHSIRLSAVRKRTRELVRLHRERERARRKLRIAYDRLRRLTRRLEVAKEDERKRIAGELHDEMGESLRKAGQEFGSTTGRPRRCGWFDAVAIRAAVRLNGMTGLAVTKLDVLNELDSIKVCTAYSYQGQLLEEFPRDADILHGCKPVYEEFEGWCSDTCDATSMAELPAPAKAYLAKLEELAGCPVALVSVGPRRDQTIQVSNPFV